MCPRFSAVQQESGNKQTTHPIVVEVLEVRDELSLVVDQDLRHLSGLLRVSDENL